MVSGRAHVVAPLALARAAPPRRHGARGRRRRSVDPVTAQRRALVAQVVGLLFLVAVTGAMVWKAMHVV